MMDRRTFIGAVAAGMIAAPLAAREKTATIVRRIGVLYLGAGPLTPAEIEEEAAPLRALGWVEGRNLLVERRYAERAELLRPRAEELVRLEVEIIVTDGTPSALAAKNATTTIPIIITAGDPVRSGLVASLGRPGGNITGFSLAGPEINAKSLSLLRELVPGLQRVGVLENSTNPHYRAVRKDFEQTCRSLGLQPIFVEVAAAGELESAIAEMARRGAQALFVHSDGLFIDNRVPLMSAALRHALPTFAAGGMLEAGALVSYDGSDDVGRRHAALIDKILRGAKPADLPIEQPTRFELMINLKTAKALGITVPPELLARTSGVIR
jgi:putative ABC transport system substrate-binding protein